MAQRILPIYEMEKKQFQKEMEQLDLFLKMAFAKTDVQHLQDYMLAEPSISPPYFLLFDAYSIWLIDEILTSSSPSNRGLVIKRVIKLAQFFYRSGNFQAYLTTLMSLRQESIIRLKKSWACVAKKYYMWMLNEVQACFTENHAYLQKAMDSYEAPFFPYLPAYQKAVSTTFKNIARLHQQLAFALKRISLLPSSFVAGVQKWKAHGEPQLISRFLSRSKLLE